MRAEPEPAEAAPPARAAASGEGEFRVSAALPPAAPTALVSPAESADSTLVLTLGIGLGLMVAATLPRAVAGPRSRWVERGQLAVGATGLVCAFGAFAVLLAGA